MNRLTYLLFAGLLATSCVCTKKPRKVFDPYPDDLKLTDTNGWPKDTLMSWLPDSILRGNGYQPVINEDFMMEFASASLCAAKEPVLFNTYTGRSVYRYYQGGGLQVPIIISLWRKENTVGITVKLLDCNPQAHNLYFISPGSNERTIVKADRKANIAFQKTFPLTLRDWTEFEKILLENEFWYQEPFAYKYSGGTDQPITFLEAHLPNNYHVSYSGPALDFLVRKSGMQKYFRYS